MTTKRKWLTKIKAEEVGAQYTSFYAMREGLMSLTGQCVQMVENLEELALNGQFEQAYREYLEFWENKVPENRKHFENMITMEAPKE